MVDRSEKTEKKRVGRRLRRELTIVEYLYVYSARSELPMSFSIFTDLVQGTATIIQPARMSGGAPLAIGAA